jgi:hypothetical protein
MLSVPRYYEPDSFEQRVSCWWKLSAVQLGDMACSSWLVSERIKLSVLSQPVKRRLGGWYEMATSLGPT